LHGNAPRNIFQVGRDIIETKSIATKFYKKMNFKITISKSIATKFHEKKHKPQKHHISLEFKKLQALTCPLVAT
jgi:hypothetical protein